MPGSSTGETARPSIRAPSSTATRCRLWEPSPPASTPPVRTSCSSPSTGRRMGRSVRSAVNASPSTSTGPSTPQPAAERALDGEPLSQLVERLQANCLERGVSVATAESCTGGLVAKLITDLAGSSGYFRGGVVSYADEATTRLLGVAEDQLAAHGAVSAPVARSRAGGALRSTGADLGVPAPGVAGPGGGSPAKPVGLS